MSRKKDRGHGEHAQRRNAHAVAARQRKAGPIEERERDTCHICGRDMGFAPPSYICAPCEQGEECGE